MRHAMLANAEDRRPELGLMAGGASRTAQGTGGTIGTILAYVHRHYTHDLSLDMIAEHTRLHPNYISALFRQRLGVSFLHYLHAYRIERAKWWMASEPKLPVREIGGKVGFESENHFYSLFKRYTGMTPGQYRTRHIAR